MSTGLEALPVVDHAAMKYPPFRRAFYSEHADVRAMTETEVAAFRSELGIVASGHDVVRPIKSFMQAGAVMLACTCYCACLVGAVLVAAAATCTAI